MEVYLGLVIPFTGAYAPQYTAQCLGQQMQVGQNQALFAITGAMYGGNGTTNFNLPDLRGRVMIGSGSSPYLNNQTLNPGNFGGVANTTITLQNLPAHTHAATFTPSGSSTNATVSAAAAIPVSTVVGGSSTPAGGNNYLGALQLTEPGLGVTLDGPYSSGTAPNGSALVGSASGTVTMGGLTGTVSVAAGGGVTNPTPVNNMQPYVALTMLIITSGIFPMRD
ncbi:phage tail protein [Azospirillum formosense]|uniref:Phage tail protein n=1 Tax=Azospirillum formosense TaxID=861533 RepID=A0ABX2KZU3_9PROT|nr:tail fiber protein [Azospirillum formosense]MBY3756263.1 phage tail protein [Azospirillum formosense]NUB22178.1 phage tail protein [Azospirillum formosense]